MRRGRVIGSIIAAQYVRTGGAGPAVLLLHGFGDTGDIWQPLPVLAIGGDHWSGAAMKTELEFVATNVECAVIANAGHWIMEEQPEQAVSLILRFIHES